MTCVFGLAELVNHNPFLRDMEETGYLIDFVGGHLVFYGWPYLDHAGGLCYGDLAFTLDLNGYVIDPPQSHQGWWRGSKPCDQTGRALLVSPVLTVIDITHDLRTDFAFSLKLHDEQGVNRAYRSFEEKVQTYLDVITGPALAAYPDATPLRAIERMAKAQGTPLKFPDMMSARYGMNDISMKLAGKRVAIIGLGGTGSYVLDFIARTHLLGIGLFDDDKIHVHTVFRLPGFIANAIGKLKVDVLAAHYDQWHGGIVPVPERITPENIEQLQAYDFVFVSVDDGPSRQQIIDWLSANNIPFVDCGMGLNRVEGGLSGFVRISGVNRQAYERNVGTVRLPVGDAKEDEYRRQAQITELNAFNAAMAVIRFKQHFGMLAREDQATSYIFDTADFKMDPGEGE